MRPSASLVRSLLRTASRDIHRSFHRLPLPSIVAIRKFSRTVNTHQDASPSPAQDFVPAHLAPSRTDLQALQKILDSARRLLILTGAGLSTESGIPDYRSEGVGLYARTDRRPMQYQEFIKSAEARQRYWARNFVGWPKFSSFEPNVGHRVIADWNATGKVLGVVTQNVDALHTKAGTREVIELHGCSDRVRCLSCHRLTRRHDLQTRFEEANPTWRVVDMPIAPDGDVLLDEDQVKGFKVSACRVCDGPLIPDVTFFGDSVPRAVVDKVYDMVDSADVMLVAGSSLHVYSGYRFAARAAARGIPLVLVSVGETRADHLATLKVDALCGHVLPAVTFDNS